MSPILPLVNFRPDVALFSGLEAFACLHGACITEDFIHAMWEAAGRAPGCEARAQLCAAAALRLAAQHAEVLPEHPLGFRVNMVNPDPGDTDPVPLLLARTAGGQLILGILSDARPEPTNKNSTPPP